jgi:hypothetical protein
MKLSVFFQFLDLGQSAGLLGTDDQLVARPLRVCAGWLWGWISWWNEWSWQGKPKYSKRTCPDATLFTTNPICQARARTRSAAVGSQRPATNPFSHSFCIMLSICSHFLLIYTRQFTFSPAPSLCKHLYTPQQRPPIIVPSRRIHPSRMEPNAASCRLLNLKGYISVCRSNFNFVKKVRCGRSADGCEISCLV